MAVNDHATRALKEEGNVCFRGGDYDRALVSYSNALLHLNCEGGECSADEVICRAALHKNRAACHLKRKDYEEAIKDCDQALTLMPRDSKALFRRCQAYENSGRIELAYRDACETLKVDPKNTAIQPVLARLHALVQEMSKERDSLDNRVSQVFQLLFDGGSHSDREKRLQAANNCVVLAKERVGAEKLFRADIYDKFFTLFKTEKDPDIVVAAIRVIGELCRTSLQRTKDLLGRFSAATLLVMLNSKYDTQVAAGQHCIQTILNVLSGTDTKKSEKPDKTVLQENKSEIYGVMKSLVHCVNGRSFTAIGRDSVLELIMKNVDYECLDWGVQLVEVDGLYRILEVASELSEINYESSMDITENTRTIVSVTLQRAYDALTCDKHRDLFREKVDEFVKDKLRGPDIESKVRVTAAITVLLQGPLDVGNYCIAQQGVLEMMLVMASADDIMQQRVAAEAIIAAASKKDKCSSIAGMGMDILTRLYQSNDDGIRVRALVGLCKIGSMGGTDASIKPFADGTQLKLANACRKLLKKPVTKDTNDIRKWAAEGLSFLTLDAEVKEELVQDKNAVVALIELAKMGNQSCLYGVVTTLVNLTNSYEKQEIMPEMIEMAKFAKQHIPVEHPKDAKEHVEKRIKALTELGVTSGLVALSKTQAKNSRELIGRVFNAICEYPNLRGAVVQQGGTKVLLPLSLDGTEKGKLAAAQALARIGISLDPAVSFPGQRALEVVRPLLQLLHLDCSGLQNFEALLALCNLAQLSPSVRSRIISEKGVAKIESYMYEDHEMLKRAATQCMVNMFVSDEVVELYEGENDRIKYWTLIAVDDDKETSLAACKGLAILTGRSHICCEKVLQPSDWLDILKLLLASEDAERQYCGACIVSNVMASKKSTAERLIETDIMEILMAVSQLEESSRRKAKDYAKLALESAEKWKLIRPNVDGGGNADDEEHTIE